MPGEFGAVERGGEEEAQRRGRAVERRRLHAALGQMHLEAAHILCRCRVGRASQELGKHRDVADIVVAGLLAELRTAMSSSMRRRRSLVGLSLIGGSCLEVGGLGTPRSSRRSTLPVILSPSPSYRAGRHRLHPARSALPRERVRSMAPNCRNRTRSSSEGLGGTTDVFYSSRAFLNLEYFCRAAVGGRPGGDEPPARGSALALGAMPVATGIVGDERVAAGLILAACDVPAERRRAAALDGVHHLELVEADVTAIGLTPIVSVVAEDLRDLQSCAGHAGGALCQRPAPAPPLSSLAWLRQQVELGSRRLEIMPVATCV